MTIKLTLYQTVICGVKKTIVMLVRVSGNRITSIGYVLEIE